MRSISTELADFEAAKNIPEVAEIMLLVIRAPLRPILSANHEPPRDPVAPPTKNIETIADQSTSN